VTILPAPSNPVSNQVYSSEHGSLKYGQHYTAEEAVEIFASSQPKVDTVHNWLFSAGISAETISQSVNKQWMQFDASTRELESLLNTEYHTYEHADTGKTTVVYEKYVDLLKLAPPGLLTRN
jgi:tripeptidyl-peptidase I